MPIKNNVIFSGFNELDNYEKKRIKELIFSKTEKLEREFKNLRSLRFHFKKYSHGGRDKFSVHLLIDGPTRPIAIETNTINWDVVTVINRIFDKAMTHLGKVFKTYEKRPRSSKLQKLNIQ